MSYEMLKENDISYARSHSSHVMYHHPGLIYFINNLKTHVLNHMQSSCLTLNLWRTCNCLSIVYFNKCYLVYNGDVNKNKKGISRCNMQKTEIPFVNK